MEYRDEVERMRDRGKRRSSMGQTRQRRPERTQLEVIDFNDFDDREIRRLSQKKKARRRRKRGLLFFELLLLCILLAGTYLFFFKKKESKYWTVAVFGVDSRDGGLEKDTHSDVEMVCVVNRETGEIRIVSIFRDTYLQVNEDGKYHKINQAYFDGGHKQAVDALNRNLDLQIDDYATFNWKAVAQAINILGGIDLEVSDSEFRYINGFITETVNYTGIGSYQLEHAGMQHLDGVQSVAYARLRLMDTDYHRTARQRLVLSLAMEKAKQADFKTLTAVVGAVFPQISTSIGVDDLISLAKNVKKYHVGETGGFPFSRGEADVGKKDCVVPMTLESNVIQLHQFLYDDMEYQPSATVRQISAKIASDSGLGQVAENAPDAKVGGGSSSSGQNSETQAQVSETVGETIPEETLPPESATEPESTESVIEESTETSSESVPESKGENEESAAGPSAPETTEALSPGGPTISEENKGPSGPMNPTQAPPSPGVFPGQGSDSMEGP